VENDIKIKTNAIYNKDCLPGMSKLPDGSIDLVLLDFNLWIWYNRFMEKYICPVCETVFYKKVYKKVQAVYCSQECAYKGRSLGYTKRIIKKPYKCKRKQPRICPICQTGFIYGKTTQKYCSRKCYEVAKSKQMAGRNNPSYIDGRSYNKRCYRGNDWETLREEIYERDNYTCQDCRVRCIGKRDAMKENYEKIIQCHHIENYKKNHNNNKSNLITLCLKCHLKRHQIR